MFRARHQLNLNRSNAYPKSFDSTFGNELQQYLAQSGVAWRQLDDFATTQAEEHWRTVYAAAFRKRPRARHGARADHEFSLTECTQYLIVPFLSRVDGLPIDPRYSQLGGYECRGPLVPLGAFHNAEFFVCPPDFAWCMVHTHEDHALGGPYFIRAEWVP